jgi:rSAM/selenodomain-associated transferase 2
LRRGPTEPIPGLAIITVIIPFLNEERALPATLAALIAQAAPMEVIAVDAGSTDGSRDILACHPQLRVIDAERGRAQQMNAGAGVARGSLLLFLHADTVLPRGALPALQARLADPDFKWGGFRQAFSGSDWRLRIISWLHNHRCRMTKVFYGDQGLFVQRALFEQAGGFPLGRMEDIALSERLLRLAQPSLIDLAVTTDARKFVRMGVWKSLGRVVTILICARFGWRYPTEFFADVR